MTGERKFREMERTTRPLDLVLVSDVDQEVVHQYLNCRQCEPSSWIILSKVTELEGGCYVLHFIGVWFFGFGSGKFMQDVWLLKQLTESLIASAMCFSNFPGERYVYSCASCTAVMASVMVIRMPLRLSLVSVNGLYLQTRLPM
jgi:hypothetical protein